jgi:nucleoside-diphosphate-sugar epimerase
LKALVTGGTGFIGSGVVDLLLREGHSVRLITRMRGLPETLKGKDVEIFQCDLKNFTSATLAMDGVDLFFHIGEIKNTTEAASLVNVRLVEQILAHMAKEEIKRFIFVSSLTVSGIPSVVPANEDTPPGEVLEDHYTAYKRKCEKLIIDALPGRYAILRPAPVYGPGSRYLGKFIRAIDRFGPIGFPFIGNARNLVPLIYVKDLARAIYLSGTRPSASGHVFNITDGIRHSWLDFLSTIAEQLGKKLRIMPIPPLLLKIPAVPLDIFSSLVGIKIDPVQYLNYFSKDLFFENTRARNLLGWEAEYSIEKGIGEMLKFYR